MSEVFWECMYNRQREGNVSEVLSQDAGHTLFRLAMISDFE